VQFSQEVYNYAGILHTGYTQELYTSGDTSPAGCCQTCFDTPGCVVGISLEYGGGCAVLLNNIQPVVGANAQCPTGYDVIDSFYGMTVGLPSVNTNYAFTLGPCFAGTVAP